MTKHQYIALLRGINVGGKNIIKMADLKACFEDMGYSDVVTYIQSGNVVFKTEEKNTSQIIEDLEAALSKKFGYNSRLVVITSDFLKQTVKNAPPGFGSEPDKFRYDVIFLKAPMTTKEAMKSVTTREGVDNVYTGNNVLYFSRLIARASQSHLSKIVSLPVYKHMTIRNWNTTTRLLAMTGGDK